MPQKTMMEEFLLKLDRTRNLSSWGKARFLMTDKVVPVVCARKHNVWLSTYQHLKIISLKLDPIYAEVYTKR